MTPEAWKQAILREILHIADKNYQEKAWFGKGKYVSSLDEMYCTLFDDFIFEDFLESPTINLSEKQRRLGEALRDKLNDYYPDDASVDEYVAIQDPKWHEVRESAKLFYDSLKKE